MRTKRLRKSWLRLLEAPKCPGVRHSSCLNHDKAVDMIEVLVLLRGNKPGQQDVRLRAAEHSERSCLQLHRCLTTNLGDLVPSDLFKLVYWLSS